ncbi:hypothetical protein [Haloferula sp. BvORR071]|uniref:hypothetical protein n=1 Tax=Haloferula sp. BvORR071 TaxID=1396141 RepID=UPI00054D0E42|nr:hypothetical protein [Haloferula sp. BvORR071]
MKSIFSAAVLAAFLPILCPLASAQKKEAQPKGDCRVRCVVAQPGSMLPEELHIHDAAGSATAGKIKVKTFLNHEFDLLVTKGGPVVITTKPEPASVKTEEDVVGKCELPAKAPSLILLLAPEAADKIQSKVTVLDATAKAFPPGSFYLVNLSTVPITVELETEKFECKAGESTVIKKPPVGEGSMSSMKAFREKDGKQEQISSGSWPSPGQKRVLQIFLENPSSKDIEVSSIQDLAKP